MQLCTCGDTQEGHFPLGHRHGPSGSPLSSRLVGMDDGSSVPGKGLHNCYIPIWKGIKSSFFFSASTIIAAAISRIQ